MEQIAKDRYNGTLKKGELSDEYILETYKELNGAMWEGFGKDNFKVNKQTGAISPEVLQMQRNLYKFSGAKNYVLLEQINEILRSDKGKNWQTFLQEVQKLNPKYNKNYLQAEWQTAKQAGYHAANWQEYMRMKDIYPNLKYMTVKDNKVRESHQLLDGFIAPIDSNFWKVCYPPNGWRCRCYVVQTAEPASQERIAPNTLSDKDFPKEFRGNVAISGQLFKEDSTNQGKPHPYFALALDADIDTKKAFELSKLKAPYTEVYEAKNGAVVKVSPFADESDLAKNLKSAIVIADNLGVSMNIRPHLEIQNHKNPEYEINSKIADRKETSSYTSVKSNLGKAKEQGAEIVVFDLSDFKNWEAIGVVRSLKGKILSYNNREWLKEVFFIYGNKAISFTIKELMTDFDKVTTRLKAIEP
jgi:hypothetical protein|nr:MAG TPA: minor capsid component [Caudoviricetes sp.]